MGVSKQQALENRQAIIAASEKLFREHGIDGVGLSALMKAAAIRGSHDRSTFTCRARIVGISSKDVRSRGSLPMFADWASKHRLTLRAASNR